MEMINIKPGRYYSNGTEVRKVVRIDSMVYYCTCEFFEPISENMMTGVTTSEFAQCMKFEVVPNWAKVVR